MDIKAISPAIGYRSEKGIEWPSKTILGKPYDRESEPTPRTRNLKPGSAGYFVIVDFQADKDAVDAEVEALEAKLSPKKAKADEVSK